MREIKFRGKASLYNIWVYGCYCATKINTFIIDENGELFPIYKDTVGQYTGLKDKNGKEIYEGDLIKNNWHDIYQEDIGKTWCVKYGEYDNSDIEYGSSGNIGFYACDITYGEEEGLNNLPCDDNDGIEIIGNIYESEV